MSSIIRILVIQLDHPPSSICNYLGNRLDQVAPKTREAVRANDKPARHPASMQHSLMVWENSGSACSRLLASLP